MNTRPRFDRSRSARSRASSARDSCHIVSGGGARFAHDAPTAIATAAVANVAMRTGLSLQGSLGAVTPGDTSTDKTGGASTDKSGRMALLFGSIAATRDAYSAASVHAPRAVATA